MKKQPSTLYKTLFTAFLLSNASSVMALPTTANFLTGGGSLNNSGSTAVIDVTNVNAKRVAVVNVDNANIAQGEALNIYNSTGFNNSRLIINDKQGVTTHINGTLATDLTTVVVNPQGIHVGSTAVISNIHGVSFIAGTINEALVSGDNDVTVTFNPASSSNKWNGSVGRVTVDEGAVFENLADGVGQKLGVTCDGTGCRDVYENVRDHVNWNTMDGVVLDTGAFSVVEGAAISDGTLHYDSDVMIRNSSYKVEDWNAGTTSVIADMNGNIIMDNDTAFAAYQNNETTYQTVDMQATLSHADISSANSLLFYNVNLNNARLTLDSQNGKVYLVDVEGGNSIINSTSDVVLGGNTVRDLTLRTTKDVYTDTSNVSEAWTLNQKLALIDLDIQARSLKSIQNTYGGTVDNYLDNATSFTSAFDTTFDNQSYWYGTNTVHTTGGVDNYAFTVYGHTDVTVDGDVNQFGYYNALTAPVVNHAGSVALPVVPDHDGALRLNGATITGAYVDNANVILGAPTTLLDNSHITLYNNNSVEAMGNVTMNNMSDIKTYASTQYVFVSDPSIEQYANTVTVHGDLAIRNDSGIIDMKTLTVDGNLTMSKGFVNINNPDGFPSYAYKTADYPDIHEELFIHPEFRMTVGGNLAMSNQSVIGGRTGTNINVLFKGAVTTESWNPNTANQWGSITANHITLNGDVVNTGRFSAPVDSIDQGNNFLTVNGTTSLTRYDRVCFNLCAPATYTSFGTVPVVTPPPVVVPPVVVPPVEPPPVVIPPVTPPVTPPVVNPPVVAPTFTPIIDIRISDAVEETSVVKGTLYVPQPGKVVSDIVITKTDDDDNKQS